MIVHPVDIPGLVADYDPQVLAFTDQSGTIRSEIGDPVRNLPDQRRVFGAISRSDALQPAVLRKDSRGWRYLDFTAGNLYSYSAPTLAIPQPFTVAMVHVPLGTGTGTFLGLNGTNVRILRPASPAVYGFTAGTLVNSVPVVANQMRRICAVFNGSNSVFRIDSSEVSGNAGTADANSLSLNGHSGGGGSASPQYVYRLLCWQRALTSTERKDLDRYLLELYTAGGSRRGFPMSRLVN